MKKLSILFLTIFIALVLAACGETEDKPVKSVETSGEASEESTDQESSDSEDAEAETEESEAATYDEVLLDDEVATVTLKSIETVRDDIFGDEHNIKLEIENKSDATIEVQANEVSIDGLMVDDMVFFSETVAGGKKANASMDIMALDEELPELSENLELILKIIDGDSFMEISSTDVSIDVQ